MLFYNQSLVFETLDVTTVSWWDGIGNRPNKNNVMLGKIKPQDDSMAFLRTSDHRDEQFLSTTEKLDTLYALYNGQSCFVVSCIMWFILIH